MIRMLQEYDGNTALVCVDSYAGGVPRGLLYSFSHGTMAFSSLTELLLGMETFLEESGQPQAYTVSRRFGEGLPPFSSGESHSRMPRGKLATFALRVCYRRHSSWQGRLLWQDRQDGRSFRSVLELILLMDSALRAAERSDAG